MYYDIPQEIKNSRCWFLNSNDNIVSYPTNNRRQQWVRSGTKWYKYQDQTSSYNYDFSTYTCFPANSQIEYEYSHIEPIYYSLAFWIGLCAIGFAFYLIIYKLFKGGMKW